MFQTNETDQYTRCGDKSSHVFPLVSPEMENIYIPNEKNTFL